jgi:hypothetical protein
MPGSLGSFACPWQRSFFATPLRAISMCWPQPDHVGFLHLRHVVLLHILFPLIFRYEAMSSFFAAGDLLQVR